MNSPRLVKAFGRALSALLCAITVQTAVAATNAVERVRVACIGDSITYGTGLANRAVDSYPRRLQDLLDARFPGRYEVRNFGNPGRGVYLDTFRGKEKRGYRFMKEHAEALAWQPDIVISNLGINDIGHYPEERDGRRARGTFVRDYLTLLDDYRKLSSKPKLFIWTRLGPLTPRHSCFNSRAPFQMVRDLTAVARRSGATGLDLLTPFLPNPEPYLTKDGIHPNPEGAKLVAEAVFADVWGDDGL